MLSTGGIVARERVMTYGEVLGWVFLIVGGLMLSGRATTLAAALIGLVRRRPHFPR